MRSFKPLAIASTVATFLLVAIGGLVRATKSGLGCGTDWPHCSGKLVPELEQRAQIIEFSHRAVAGIVVTLLAALALLAFRHYRRTPRVVALSVTAFGLVMFQAVLGAVVVKLELQALSVVLHLATAMALLGVLVQLIVNLTPDGVPATDRDLNRRARVAAGSVLLLLLVGSYVSGSDAGGVFGDWPLMNGRLVPDLSVEPQAIHFLHRLLAAVVGVVVFVVAWGAAARRSEFPRAAFLAHAAAGLFAIEVVVGAANVWTGLNAAFVTAHLAIGAGIWTCLVGMAAVTHPRTIEERPTRVTRSDAVLETQGAR